MLSEPLETRLYKLFQEIEDEEPPLIFRKVGKDCIHMLKLHQELHEEAFFNILCDKKLLELAHCIMVRNHVEIGDI